MVFFAKMGEFCCGNDVRFLLHLNQQCIELFYYIRCIVWSHVHRWNSHSHRDSLWNLIASRRWGKLTWKKYRSLSRAVPFTGHVMVYLTLLCRRQWFSLISTWRMAFCHYLLISGDLLRQRRNLWSGPCVPNRIPYSNCFSVSNEIRILGNN